MGRLANFNYKSPYFYMVTLKRLDGLAAFSEVGPEGLIENGITRAFNAVIRGFHLKWRCCEEISPFVIMPDHLHLLVKIRDIPDRVALGVLVSQLSKALRNAYWQIVAPDGATGKTLSNSAGLAGGAAGFAGGAAGFAGGAAGPASGAAGFAGGAAGFAGGAAGFAGGAAGFAGGAAGFAGGAAGFAGGAAGPASGASAPPPPIFEKDWHDWIVKRQGQLAAFRRYIRENASRAWLRRQNAQFFSRISHVAFLGREWFAYGNHTILDLPILTPFKGHRATQPNSPDWLAMVDSASRIGPGGVGISTFMSPLEKACGNAIYKAGGKMIMLCPEGFGPRWHPPREKERLCAAGRMLFLSLYDARASQPTRQELYSRCHEMVDLALAGLSPQSR